MAPAAPRPWIWDLGYLEGLRARAQGLEALVKGLGALSQGLGALAHNLGTLGGLRAPASAAIAKFWNVNFYLKGLRRAVL